MLILTEINPLIKCVCVPDIALCQRAHLQSTLLPRPSPYTFLKLKSPPPPPASQVPSRRLAARLPREPHPSLLTKYNFSSPRRHTMSDSQSSGGAPPGTGTSQFTRNSNKPTTKSIDTSDPDWVLNSQPRLPLCTSTTRAANPPHLRAGTLDLLTRQTARRAVQVPGLCKLD